jgi:hypothetical protein
MEGHPHQRLALDLEGLREVHGMLRVELRHRRRSDPGLLRPRHDGRFRQAGDQSVRSLQKGHLDVGPRGDRHLE